MAVERVVPTATLLPNGQVLVAGGFKSNNIYTASVELYDPYAATPITLSQAIKLPSGAFRFGFTNKSGAIFTALASTNVASSVSTWSILGNPVEIAPGQFQFTDAGATNLPQHYYRVRWP